MGEQLYNNSKTSPRITSVTKVNKTMNNLKREDDQVLEKRTLLG